MRLFAIRLNEALSVEQKEILQVHLDSKQQRAIEKYRFTYDRDIRLVTHNLLRIMLQKVYGLKRNELHMDVNLFGKPYLTERLLYFNVSHSGCWALCAIDEEEIGIDIEKQNEVDIVSVASFFSKGEQAMLAAVKEAKRVTLFYRLWTLKESYIKKIGYGLSYPLHSFTIVESDGQYRLKLENGLDDDVFFQTYDIDPHYAVAVCSGKTPFPESIHILTVEQLCRDVGEILDAIEK